MHAVLGCHLGHGDHQAVLAVEHHLGGGGFENRHAELGAFDLVFLAVHAQQFGVREGRDIGFRGEHVGGEVGDRHTQILCKAVGDGLVFLRRGGRAEFQRVGQDAGQHRALDPRGGLGQIVADHLPHDGGGAGDGFDADLDGALGFKAADQLVMVDDRADVGAVDRGGQFGGVVCVDDDDGLIGGDVRDDLGLVELPVVEHERRFGVGFAEQDGLGVLALDLVEIPRPDDRAAGAVCVGGLVSENEGGHWGLCSAKIGSRAL